MGRHGTPAVTDRSQSQSHTGNALGKLMSTACWDEAWEENMLSSNSSACGNLAAPLWHKKSQRVAWLSFKSG